MSRRIYSITVDGLKYDVKLAIGTNVCEECELSGICKNDILDSVKGEMTFIHTCDKYVPRGHCFKLADEPSRKTIDQFVELVKQMRHNQRRYFNLRRPEILATCKELERQVDEAIAEITNLQKQLF
jgi:hypothetical protein